MSTNQESGTETGTGTPPPSTGSESTGTKPSRKNRRGNRKKNDGGSNNAHRAAKPHVPKFTGNEDGLSDEFVYSLAGGANASSQYAKTTEGIIRYTSNKYKSGGDVERSLSEGVKFIVTWPPAPTDTITPGARAGDPDVVTPPTLADMTIWKMQAQMGLQRRALLDSNLVSCYQLVTGQCSKAILEKVEAQAGYTTVHQNRDVIALLDLIKRVMFNYNSRKYRALTLIGIGHLSLVTQTRYMSVHEYMEKLRTQLDVLKSAGGDYCVHFGMVEDELTAAGVGANPTEVETEAAEYRARGRFEGALFLVRSDQSRYGLLVEELANDYNKGQDHYPTTMMAAYELMLHDVRTRNVMLPAGAGGMAFGTLGEEVQGKHEPVMATQTQPNPRPDVTCYRCKKKGHFENHCMEVNHANGTTLAQFDYCEETDSEQERVEADDPVDIESGPAQEDEPQLADNEEDGMVNALLGSIDDDLFEDGFHFLNDGVVLGQEDNGGVPKWWILLDNQSTVDVFCNEELLKNIREAPTTCRIRCNAGVVYTNLVGDLQGYPAPVWYHPDGIANILSLFRVSQHCRVEYASDSHGGAFRVDRDDGSVREFRPSHTGLHYSDTKEFHTLLVNTVADNRSNYTNRAYRKATLARRIQNVVSRPSTRDYTNIVEGGMIKNCPIVKADIKAAEDIFGPNIGSLKGKTPRRENKRVPSLVADVPYRIIKTHRDVTLCFDIMFVNKIAFLVTVSRNIRFGTTERLTSRQADVVGQALVKVLKFYRQRGFRVKECHGDGEFEALRAEIADAKAQLNVTAEDEHVAEIERYIRTVKERTRATYHVMPFKRFPGVMIVEMVHAANFWLNMFPARDGVSATQSPRRIMTGQSCDYHLHCRLEYGEYAQVHESHDNSMATRTTGAIALRPTGNIQGGYFFMSLTTGQRLNRYDWTALPMPHEVIERVHTLARRSKASNADLEFGWRDATPILDEDGEPDDDSYDPDDESSVESDSDDDGSYDTDNLPAAGVDNEYVDHHQHNGGAQHDDDEESSSSNDDDDSADDADDDADDDEHDIDDDEHEHNESSSESESESDDDDPDEGGDPDRVVTTDENESDEDTAADTDAPQQQGTPEGVHSEGVHDEGVHDEGVHAEGVDRRRAQGRVTFETPETSELADATAGMDEKYGPRGRPGLRRRRPTRTGEEQHELPSSGHRAKPKEPTADHMLHAMIECELGGLKGFTEIEHIALVQYNLKKGLAIYGKDAAEAVIKEMKQLHDRNTIEPRMANELSTQDKWRALAYLMFIKQKRDGTIKGRGCADGRKQRLYKAKDETSSPTVRTESLMLSCTIDAHEGRNVMTCDVPGAFMQVDVDEVVHVRLEGALAELLTKVDPELYTKYQTKEKGKTVLYVQLKKALYGTLSAALLFWKDLSGHLESEGFVANPYDNCVMNKMIKGRQCTILWHVDDLKISHMMSSVVEGMLDRLNTWYGQVTPLTVTRGDIHEYLGMTIDYSTPKKVAIRMEDYLEGVMDDVPDSMDGEAVTPAAEHLFKVNAEAEKLDSEKKDLYHSTVAKLLFLCKRARPDIQTPVAFLCTRVREPDVDDMKKLTRVICYLRSTKTLYLTLEAENLQVIKWWVDASFAVHADMRSHTGATMSLGKGSVYSASTRQKLNTKSSTEAELVGVDDIMPMILWTRQFMMGQGYTVSDNVVYQDNQSAMLLENNGTRSSSKRTRHLDIRYFFVTDRIRAKQMRVEYCPTGDMWADVFTKPLQGAAFYKFRQLILNLPA